jgi:TonB family protein
MDSPDDLSNGPSLPRGNTTAIDPGRSAPHDGGTPKPLARAVGGRGWGELPSIKAEPEIDTEACGRMIHYPKEAIESGIEGDVKLRVTLDETGRVKEVKVLRGLGHGLDQEAVAALRQRCRFAPAIATDGRAVPYIVEPYIFHFEIPR